MSLCLDGRFWYVLVYQPMYYDAGSVPLEEGKERTLLPAFRLYLV